MKAVRAMKQIVYTLILISGFAAGFIAEPAKAGPDWPITQMTIAKAV